MRIAAFAFAVVLTPFLSAPAVVAGQAQNPPAQEAPKPAPPTGIAGKWTMSIQTPNGGQDVALELKLDGAKLTGTIASPQGSVPIEGEYKEKTLSFLLSFETGNGTFSIYFSGAEQDNGTLAGTADMGEMGQMSWSAKRAQ